MSVLEDVLVEEYGRSLRLTRLMKDELAALPKGSIRIRVVHGHEYYYLNYRDGSRVVSNYIKACDVDGVREKIARRKELQSALKEQERSRKQIERALGRRLAIE